MNENVMYIDSENLENIVKKLNMYIKEEQETINDFENYYNNVSSCYNSDNDKLLDQINMQTNYNLKKVKINHDSNIFLINKRIQDVKNKLENLKRIEDSAKIDRIV